MIPNTTTHPRMAHTPSRASVIRPLGQAFVALLLGFALFAALLALLPVTYTRMYDGMIFPGVAVSGVDLSGLSTEQAAALLTKRLDYPREAKSFSRKVPTCGRQHQLTWACSWMPRRPPWPPLTWAGRAAYRCA